MDIMRRAAALPFEASSTAFRIWRAAGGLLLAAEAVPLLLIRVDTLLSAAQERILAIAELTTEAGKATAGVDALRSEAGGVTARVDALRAEAAGVTARAASLVARADGVLDSTEPLLAAVAEIDPDLVRNLTAIVQRLRPLLDRVATLDPGLAPEVADLVHDSLPLVRQLVTFLPLLEELRRAVPEVRQILEVVERLEPAMVDVEKRIAGLPGAGFMLRRGEREIEERAESAAE